MCRLRWSKVCNLLFACCLWLFLGGVLPTWAGDPHSKKEGENRVSTPLSVSDASKEALTCLVVKVRALEHLLLRPHIGEESLSGFYARLRVFTSELPEFKTFIEKVIKSITGGETAPELAEAADTLLWRLNAILLRGAGQGADFFDQRLFYVDYEAEADYVLDFLRLLKQALGDAFPPAVEYQAATLRERYRAFEQTLPGDGVSCLTHFIVRNMREVAEALLDLLDQNVVQEGFDRIQVQLQDLLRGNLYPPQLQFVDAQLHVLEGPRNLLRGEPTLDFEPVLDESPLEGGDYEDTDIDYWEAGAGEDDYQVLAEAYLAAAEGAPASLDTPEAMPWAFLNYGGGRPAYLTEQAPPQTDFLRFQLPSWSPYHRVLLQGTQGGESDNRGSLYSSFFLYYPCGRQ